MADLTSIYRNKPKRDFSIQACADCINKIALQFPNEFKEGLFTDFFDIAGGTQPPKSTFINEQREGYVKFLQIRDFSSDSTPTFIPISKNNKLCNDNDLVLGRYGASVGKILTGKTGAYNVACAKIIFLDDEKIDKDFLFYWLHSSYFQNFLTSISRSAQGGFNKNDLSRIKTFFPSIAVQRKLTSILKTIDIALINGHKIEFEKKEKNNIELSFIELVEKFLSLINEGEELSTELTHQLTLVKKLRQQLLQDAVQGKLVPQNPNDEPASELLKKIKAEKQKLIAEKKLKKEKELPPIKAEEIPFEIPEGWVWCRLGEIVNIVTSGSRDWAKYYSLEGAVFVRMGNLSKDSYNLRLDKIQYVKPPRNQEGNRTRLEENDILISITGEVGNLGLIPKDFGEAYINQHTALVRLNRNIITKFICNLFLSVTMQKQFNAPQRGMKNSFRLTDIDYLVIPLPPLSEQLRIVQKLNELMQTCNALESSIKASAAQNEKLLQQILREALRKEVVVV